MKKAILGKKIGMTQIFVADGRLVPVTVVEAGPCTVTMVKTAQTDGYEAVQVGFDELSEQRAKKLLNKPELGHFAKAGVKPARHLREFRFEDISGYSVGDAIKCDVFAEGDKIDVMAPARVTVIPALSRDGISTPARCPTVPSITVALAL